MYAYAIYNFERPQMTTTPSKSLFSSAHCFILYHSLMFLHKYTYGSIQDQWILEHPKPSMWVCPCLYFILIRPHLDVTLSVNQSSKLRPLIKEEVTSHTTPHLVIVCWEKLEKKGNLLVFVLSSLPMSWFLVTLHCRMDTHYTKNDLLRQLINI